VPRRPRDLDPAVDRNLDELIYAMLAKDPAGRPPLAAFRSTVAAVRMRRAGFSRAATPTIIVRTSPATVSLSRRWIIVTIAVALLPMVGLILVSTTRGGGAVPSAARTVPGDAPQTGSARTSVPMDAPVVTTVPLVDALTAEPRGREEPRAVAPSVRNVPHDRTDTWGSDAAVPVAVDAGKLDEGPRELPAPKAPEPPPTRPTTPPAPKTPPPDRNQTYNPFTGRPAS
jgi:hypothetical protein